MDWGRRRPGGGFSLSGLRACFRISAFVDAITGIRAVLLVSVDVHGVSHSLDDPP